MRQDETTVGAPWEWPSYCTKWAAVGKYGECSEIKFVCVACGMLDKAMSQDESKVLEKISKTGYSHLQSKLFLPTFPRTNSLYCMQFCVKIVNLDSLLLVNNLAFSRCPFHTQSWYILFPMNCFPVEWCSQVFLTVAPVPTCLEHVANVKYRCSTCLKKKQTNKKTRWNIELMKVTVHGCLWWNIVKCSQLITMLITHWSPWLCHHKEQQRRYWESSMSGCHYCISDRCLLLNTLLFFFFFFFLPRHRVNSDSQ